MSDSPIICKATRDTYARFAIVLLAFMGFGLYFFYDGAIGYRKANAAMLSYAAFARLGEEATRVSESEWNDKMANGVLISTAEGKPDCAESRGRFYPLPAGHAATQGYPTEMRNHAAMAKSWNDCWMAHSARMQYPINPGDHAHDEGAIREQWYGGAVCMLVSAILLALTIRTSRRELSLNGSTITAAGQQFDIADIESLDLRQWGVGFKGAAWFTVKGRRIKADGMTYGGFSKEQGEPAEQFMKAVLERYHGEIIDYEQDPAPAKS